MLGQQQGLGLQQQPQPQQVGGQDPNPNKDVIAANLPDSISSLTFSPNGQFICATSWDNGVRMFEVQVQEMGQQAQINATQRLQTNLGGPALCADFSADGMQVFASGCDQQLHMWNLQTQQTSVIGRHEAPIKSVHCVREFNLAVTGGWDNAIRCWDARTPTPAATITLPERCYAMAVNHPLMVVGTAERKILMYDLSRSNWQQPMRFEESPLRHQTRCIATFPDRDGFAIGSIEGRVAIHHVNIKEAGRNFAFKCHRDTQENRVGQPTVCNIYAVNSIVFHKFGTFATAGSDGVYNFWDKDSKQRLMAFKAAPNTIPCASFSPIGNLYAYALSYDWSRGSENYNPQTPNYIMLHHVKEEEIRQRKKNSGGNVRK
uniref:Anaphase-promoting complex subunit 4 WD40 domain-containing protein n=1 Tax=Aureoumbra lagunensis TaxID=44058 RepID=A0A7S3K4J4_9STRA|mmetsp:Transcript_19224/g.24945  ORF Transcript_19224/g.24945 Transcript_19224/m.24945 type:complete len:375 (+) Transcript_19224:35-1159(+)